MFRLLLSTSRSALRSPHTSSVRLFQTSSPATVNKKRRTSDAFDIAELSNVAGTESTRRLSSHLEKAYTNSALMKRPLADNKRVNIVSKGLCNDILERMKPSLLKHAGCDIIDINPGVGVWSSAVHDLLKPRKHYLMEPDHELYTPLLQPLLDESGSTYKLIPKSGAVWAQLNNLLSPDNLPQQVELRAGDPHLDSPNDTLLVLVNLGWHPKKPFRAFASVSLLVVHQLLSAVRAHSLFHRYGLIRMLVWVADDEGKQILPRNITGRRKMAIEAEVSCDGIYEIASSTVESASRRRDADINLESTRRVLKKMEEGRITTPKGRESLFQLQVINGTEDQNSEDNGTAIRRDWMDELQRLQQCYAAGEFSEHIEDVEAGVSNNQPPVKEQTLLVPNPDMKRLRVLRAWMKRLQESGKTPAKQSKLPAELEKLEAKFAAGDIPAFIDPDHLAPLVDKNLVVNPEMRRLRELRAWLGREKKSTNGPRRAELKILEAKFTAGEIPELVHRDAVPQKRGMYDRRLGANPEWKLLQYLRWRVEARRKIGKTSQLSERLMALEAKFEAGGIEPYVELDSESPKRPNDEESTNATISVQHKELYKSDGSLEEKKPGKVKKPRAPNGLKKTEEFLRMQTLKQRLKQDRGSTERAAPLFAKYEAILEMQKTVQNLGASDAEDMQREIDERTAEFHEVIDNLGGHEPETFRHRLDNHRTFQNDPPILYWDRREAEPLQVMPDEFYPQHGLCLLDFHPSPLWPVLRQDFPASYDIFEYILSSIFTLATQSVKSALKATAPGALEWLQAECPSLTDMSKGGNPDLELLTVRCLTLEMFKEIMEAWMRWPFRPDRFELMKRSGSAAYDPDDEEVE